MKNKKLEIRKGKVRYKALFPLRVRGFLILDD